MTSFFLRHLLLLFGTGALSTLTGCVEAMSFTPEPPTVPAHRLPMNNAYLGSVHSSDLRPTFVWEPSTASASGDIRYELQFSTDSTFLDLDVTTTIETFETSYQLPTALPVSRDAPVGARYFWQVRACLRDSCSAYARSWYVNVGRVLNDYNCDGYSDLAVGAPGDDSAYPDAGRVHVYFGGKDPIVEATAAGLLGGPNELASAKSTGENLVSAGDVNGDGCAEVIWAVAANPPSTTTGYAVLFRGAPGHSFDPIPDTEIGTGQPLDGFGKMAGGVGDVNGDGFDDIYVMIQSPEAGFGRINLYHGESGSRIDVVPDGVVDFSRVVRKAGDVNGDGASDIIAGNSSDSAGGDGAGAAYLYLGGFSELFDSEIDATLLGRGYQDLYGNSVATAGDVNQDGFSDVLVGNVREEDLGGGQSGSVDLFFGGAGSFDLDPDSTISGTIGNDFFGANVQGIGDVNGDGYDDVLIGAPHSNLNRDDKIDAGKAYLYLGGSAPSFDPTADATFEGNVGFTYLGRAATSGDFNGDGLSDIAISTPGFNSDTGKVEMFLGSRFEGFDNAADATLTGTATSDSFGAGLAGF